MLFSVSSKHFNSDDSNSAATHGKQHPQIPVHYQRSYIRERGNKNNHVLGDHNNRSARDKTMYVRKYLKRWKLMQRRSVIGTK